MRAGWTTCLLLLALGACAAPQVKTAAPGQPCVQEGEASWYTPQASPNPTANGETQGAAAALTAAHPTLPFGTQVLVTNLETGRSVVVRINDRGPHDRGRIIDLSAAAAKALDMRQDGVAHVRLEIYRPGGATATPAVATTDAACLLPHTTGSWRSDLEASGPTFAVSLQAKRSNPPPTPVRDLAGDCFGSRAMTGLAARPAARHANPVT